MTADQTQSAWEVLDVSAADDPAWLALVTSRRTDVFHSPQWAAVLADSYGFEARARIIRESGVPVAGCVAVTVDDLIGRRHVGLPFSDFCDPLVDDADQLAILLGAIGYGSEPLTIKSRQCAELSENSDMHEVGSLAWHGIPISTDAEMMWSAIDPSARRAIRRATESGVVVRATRDLDDLRRFFELHLSVRKHKYRLLPQPWRFFEAIWRRFLEPGAGVLMLAELDGRPIGGIVFLEWGGRLYYKFNASDLDHLEVRPNDLALWEGMQYAADRGLDLIDLGVSDLDQPGLIRYKRKYASEEGAVGVYRRRPTDTSSGSGDVRALLSEVTELLVDPSVPDAVTERAGDRLYRYFV